MDIVIRPERNDEHYENELVVKKAFWNHYVPGCSEHYLVHKLRDDCAYVPELTRVAEYEGCAVGNIYYSRALLSTPQGDREVLTAGPLAVVPEYQRQGVGSALMRETLALARDLGYSAVIIFGSPDYYPRFGFRPCSDFGVTTAAGSSIPPFMGIELKQNALVGGGVYREPAVYTSLAADDVAAFDNDFPYMEKLRLPGQWGYEEGAQ